MTDRPPPSPSGGAAQLPDPDIIPNERRKLAVTQASDSVKQVITLSTVILTFTISFSTDITKDAVAEDQRWLYATWICLAVAVVFGVLALLAITGQVGTYKDNPDVYAGPTKFTAGGQMVFFGAALVLLVVFGVFALTGEAPDKPEMGSCTIEAPATGQCVVGGG